MSTRPVLALPQWTVLALLSQQPAHGFGRYLPKNGHDHETGRVA
jgi:hypothetical protein